MTKRKTASKWIPSLVTAIAFASMASFCHAQSTIVLSNDSSQSPAFYDGGPAGATYTWQATDGPNGGGCIKGVITDVTVHEFDPAWNVTFSSSQYYQATVQLKVDPASGVAGSAPNGYGNIQLSFRDANYSWNGVGYHTIYGPAANDWVTYVFSVPGGINVAHLQLQLQSGADWTGPITIYIGNVTIAPVPNPQILAAFTNDTVTTGWNNYGLAASYDPNIDAPYVNPVNNSAPVSLTPAGSIQFSPTSPSYQGGQLNFGFNPSQYQSVGLDVYYDGPTTPGSTNYGGFQMAIADNNAADNYAWLNVGGASFNASMIGKWTHFNFPCAASGSVSANGFAFQSTPGNNPNGATDAFTFHVDNIQVWNPVFLPSITSITKGTAGGIQMTLDGNGTANIYDQEGISSPSTNNSSVDYFWINQTPATYAFTLTNFPSPASAPQFDAHIYLDNGDSISAFNNAYSYNQTYSGSPYNMVDYLGLHVQNGTNGGVVAMIDWKTNAPNSNATNTITFNYTSMASANGTWMLTFSDNTHGSVIANDGSVSNFTLPDFSADPNYTGNFTPATSMVQFGVFKNGNTNNNNRSFTLASVGVTNASTTLADNFSGPGLTANNNWQVAEYYQFAANRAIWQPSGTAYWLTWNTASGGWGVQSSSNILNWASAGVTYTYHDSTGTNTLGAVPATNLPTGNMGFFRLVK